MTVERETDCGRVRGNERENCFEYLGIRYARAERFEYAVPVDHWDGTFDATRFGDACLQYRTYFPHLDVPERLFYHKEFREGLTFNYSEDCLNVNIYTPKSGDGCPVIVFVHGGGFNAMCNSEGYLDGEGYARRGIILAAINYRVGPFGYITHDELKKKHGRDGNFGLDDILTAIKWIRAHIRSFGGDPDNITLMGQSAGAIQTQLLCLSEQARGLFKHAVMLSGAGLFPKIGRPRQAEATHEYWESVIRESGVSSFEEFKALDDRTLLTAVEKMRSVRKDNMMITQPVIDGFLLPDSVDRLIKQPLPLDYMVSFTSNDMFTAVFAHMSQSFARQVHAYLMYFDVDAPGDSNGAFHSADLRYCFGTLSKSFRPYDSTDQRISDMMTDYIASFARSGDPNGEGRPVWKNRHALCVSRNKVKMGLPNVFKLFFNTFKGDPK